MINIDTLEDRREKFKETMFQGHVRAAIMAVKHLQKPWSVKELSQVVKKERRHVLEEQKEVFDKAVQEGLKDDIHNYFL